MPKKTQRSWFTKNIKFPGDFTETYEKFLKIAKEDPNIQSSLTPVQKASGSFSVAVRFAITFYVEANWNRYLAKLLEKQQGGKPE